MNQFSGISISNGIGIGSATIILTPEKKSVDSSKISEGEFDAGWKSFENAVASVVAKIKLELENLPVVVGTEKKDTPDNALLEAYLLMLEDTVFFDEVKEYYKNELCNISFALESKVSDYVSQMRRLNDAYLAARANDIETIFGLVQNVLLGVADFDFSKIAEGVVIVADRISPLNIVTLAKKNIKGIVLADDDKTSHTAILANYYKIPTVIGIEKIDNQIASGETVIVDANEANVYASPSDNFLASYREKMVK